VKTLYLRNVPDEVYERLVRLAAVDGMSLGALAVRELSEVSRRADNAELLSRLPDLVYPTDRIVVDLERGRDER
jgi:hypothetical protein